MPPSRVFEPSRDAALQPVAKPTRHSRARRDGGRVTRPRPFHSGSPRCLRPAPEARARRDGGRVTPPPVPSTPGSPRCWRPAPEANRRCIPAKQPVMKPTRRSAGDPSRLTASLRAAHRCVSVGIHPVFLPHAPCPAGRLAGLGAHVGSTTGCEPPRFAVLCVALRSKYTRYSSLARLVSRAPRPSRWLTWVSPQAVTGC